MSVRRRSAGGPLPASGGGPCGRRAVSFDLGRCFETGAQSLGDRAGVLGFQPRVDVGRDLQELAVARLPYLQEWAGVEAAHDRTARVQPLLELLADKIFFEPLAAG